ncbi:MAG: phosphatase PAP2 family protein [Solirubrobacteraceae bacterium]
MKLALPLTLGIVWIALTLWVKFDGPILGDARLYAWAQAHPATTESFATFQQFFGTLGSPIVGVLTALTAATVVLRNVGARQAGLVVAAAAGALVEPVVAEVVGLTDAAAQLGVLEGGYPSGHTLFAATTYGAIAWLGWRHGRREVAAIAVALIVLMGAVRATDRSHLLDEVLGGYLLGATWLCFLLSISTGPRRPPTARRT